MIDLMLWIADRMADAGEGLQNGASRIYMRHELDSMGLTKLPTNAPDYFDIEGLYNFDDDETQRTSDASFELVVELQTPTDVLAEAMGYTPDELPSGNFHIMLPDDGPNYEADDEGLIVDEDGR